MQLEHKTYDAPELLGELLLFEINPAYCRETVTLKAPAAELPMGTLLVKNADGTFQAWAAADADAAGILLHGVAASPGADVEAPAVRRGALVSASMLAWPADATDEKKRAALSSLETLGIIAG